ncbi:MAG: ATP phosphoribosyltransferase [Hyphomicrobiaceae bacterium]|nr:ATP phosphoribosyltransferase [Hyphomicrobiaceae bacterium]
MTAIDKGGEKLILALPSKGRLMEQTTTAFAAAGLPLAKTGAARGYQGEIAGWPEVEVNFISSSEIAQFVRVGKCHLGVTGEDLLRESIADCDQRVRFVAPLGFGFADVVVAVPDCWIDVRRMGDLEEAAVAYRRAHGQRMRVATKYMNLTRRYFAERGVSSYRIVESLGATEGAPAAGLAELIVDITTTGSTLKANALRVLDDGVILRSQANLVASLGAAWTPAREALVARLAQHFGKA